MPMLKNGDQGGRYVSKVNLTEAEFIASLPSIKQQVGTSIVTTSVMLDIPGHPVPIPTVIRSRSGVALRA